MSPSPVSLSINLSASLKTNLQIHHRHQRQNTILFPLSNVYGIKAIHLKHKPDINRPTLTLHLMSGFMLVSRRASQLHDRVSLSVHVELFLKYPTLNILLPYRSPSCRLRMMLTPAEQVVSALKEQCGEYVGDGVFKQVWLECFVFCYRNI